MTTEQRIAYFAARNKRAAEAQRLGIYKPYEPPRFIGTPAQIAWAERCLGHQQTTLSNLKNLYAQEAYAMARARTAASIRSTKIAIGKLQRCIANKAGNPPRSCGIFPHHKQEQQQ